MEHFVEGGLLLMGITACAKHTCQAWPCAWGLGIAGNNLFTVCLSVLRRGIQSLQEGGQWSLTDSLKLSLLSSTWSYIYRMKEGQKRNSKPHEVLEDHLWPKVALTSNKNYMRKCAVWLTAHYTQVFYLLKLFTTLSSEEGRAETGTAPGKDSQDSLTSPLNPQPTLSSKTPARMKESHTQIIYIRAPRPPRWSEMGLM